MTDYAIRVAREEDLPALPCIEAEAGRRFADAGMPEVAELSRVDHFPQSLARKLVEQGTLWIAAHREVPVGFLAAGPADGYGFIYELDVHPAHAGHKLGIKLIAACENWARAQGLKGLTLATFRDVPWNRPYYERQGFHEWPRSALGPAHERSWQSQALQLDMTKRLFMIKLFG